MKARPALEPRRLARYALHGAAASAVGTLVVLKAFDGTETWSHLADLPWPRLAELAGLSFGVWVFNAARLAVLSRALGRRLGLGRAVGISGSVEFGFAASPGGVAGPVVMLHRLCRHGLTSAEAGTIWAANVALDGVFFLLLLPAGVAVALADPRWRLGLPSLRARGGVWAAALGVAIALALAAAFARWRRRRREAAWLERLWCRAVERIAEWCRGVRFLAGRRRSAVLASLGLAALQWSCRYAILPVLLAAFGVPCHPLPLMLIQGAVLLVSLLAVIPGGGGVAELLASLLLSRLAPPALVGVLVVLWRVFTYHVNLIAGGLVFLLTMTRSPHSSHEARTPSRSAITRPWRARSTVPTRLVVRVPARKSWRVNRNAPLSRS